MLPVGTQVRWLCPVQLCIALRLNLAHGRATSPRPPVLLPCGYRISAYVVKTMIELLFVVADVGIHIARCV